MEASLIHGIMWGLRCKERLLKKIVINGEPLLTSHHCIFPDCQSSFIVQIQPLPYLKHQTYLQKSDHLYTMNSFRKPGRRSGVSSSSPLLLKLQDLYTSILEQKDARGRILSPPFVKLPLKMVCNLILLQCIIIFP